MLAFAANSILCRMALADGLIDPASFASLRVVSGALVLVLLILPRNPGDWRSRLSWPMAVALSVYLLFFAFAYVQLTAATGALILFGAVQLTMLSRAMTRGERFGIWAWAGIGLALIGLVYLLLPGLTAPDPFSAGLMAVAGLGWGVYSLLGRGADRPLLTTTGNFVLAVPMVVLACLPFLGSLTLTWKGVALAVASGALASALGYALWYAALRALSRGQAATVQLSVPVITAFLGVLLLSEPITLRLIVATVLILGGILLVISKRASDRRHQP